MTRVPWRTILTHAPTIVDAARSFYGVSRRTSDRPGDRTDASDNLATLRTRVADLEQVEAEQTAHLADLARQVQDLGVALEVAQTRVRHWVVATSVALAVSILSAAVAFWHLR